MAVHDDNLWTQPYMGLKFDGSPGARSMLKQRRQAVYSVYAVNP